LAAREIVVNDDRFMETHDNDIHERGSGLFAPDTLLASQYFDRVRRRRDLTGEQSLMCAVIEDAVDVYLKHAATDRPEHRRLFDDAERWIESGDRSWLYAFETICDYLGLHADYVRQGLRGWKARARREAAAPAAAVEPVETPDRPRAMNE
jgi:hypothetical protein